MKKGIIIISLTIFFIIGWFIYYIIRATEEINQARKMDSVSLVSNLPENYLQLFKKNDNLIFNESVVSNTRRPISQLTYMGKFRIDVCEIDTLNNLLLTQTVLESHKNQHITYYFPYRVLYKFRQCEISYKVGGQDEISKIYLNAYGDNFQTIKKNDSIVCYYFKFKNFSIKYNKDGKQDFFGLTRDSLSTVTIPIEIMFFKKRRNLYLILMTPVEYGTSLQPGTLFSLMRM
ncbi:hypothetical protein [Mucilaginibacter sp.]|uniref:hypothetical protein n=1 Tax=Mucilaginibacter sp. TaxID=1882438 RepID=UPI0028421A41|nr:hypothetical protein [Mucilaginibacter sp.]MDR3694114.1 hypothetical protein [Mucilaginibacter sp.]